MTTRKVWTATGKTGGGADDLDACGSGSVVIAAGQWAHVIVSGVFSVYELVSSGDTADGDLIIAPIAAALSAAGDSDLRWHQRTTNAGNITISASDPSGGADGDIWLKV